MIHSILHKLKITKRDEKKLIDRLIYLAGIISPLITLPQLLNIWLEKNASGVSAISWTSYLIVACFWLSYGIIHKYKPIIFAYVIWIVLDALIIIGTILYG
ncbi:MAG: hypothetical protein Q7S27_04850 [Nanoarchaeota archaeon]|nr:hypothetical protein [Nanoarchaeota archaeon]